jgi:hypothetical protein
MCIQCVAGAMTAVGAASGSRLWLEARFSALARPRVQKVARRSIVVAGVLAAGVLGPSPHGASTPTANAAAGPAQAIGVVSGPSATAASPSR